MKARLALLESTSHFYQPTDVQTYRLNDSEREFMLPIIQFHITIDSVQSFAYLTESQTVNTIFRSVFTRCILTSEFISMCAMDIFQY